MDGNGSIRGFAAILLCAYVTCVAFPALSQAAESTAVAAPAQPRPRIGLVLGGGGAKGAAHIGVLGVLDELRIPVDCIIGTSMGAVVGGTYASGMSADEVETAIRAISWQEAIGRRGLRAQVPMRRKLTGNTYSNSLEFGVRDSSLIAPSGLINTQNVDLTIQYLVGRSRGIAEFDRLPIPFRAVATDMQSGEMVVLDRGDLALAMRAELARPGLQILSNEQFNQAFTMHGSIMLLMFAMPLFTGFANWLMPLQIGTPDVAFPRLNMLAYWLFLLGSLIAASSFLTPGGAPDFGWFL